MGFASKGGVVSRESKGENFSRFFDMFAPAPGECSALFEIMTLGVRVRESRFNGALAFSFNERRKAIRSSSRSGGDFIYLFQVAAEDDGESK